MRHTMFDEKSNTLFIETDVIMPKSQKEYTYKEAFKMSYMERIDAFCTDPTIKEEINAELIKHPNCKISEFMYV